MAKSIIQWKQAEVTLTAAAGYSNPYTDVEVTVRFRHPDGMEILRPAFWDGGTTWRVRFAPTQVGRWTLSTTASDPANSFLSNVLSGARQGFFKTLFRLIV